MLALAHHISLTPLTNNPGILPFKLGICKLENYKHTFIHYYDLNLFSEYISSIDKHIGTMMHYISTVDPAVIEDSVVIRQTLLGKLELVYTKYRSLRYHNRDKRALINALGSVIKSISGNLDHEDAIKYNTAISILQSNQKHLSDKINSDISLNYGILESFNSTISTIAANQYKIYRKINEIMTEINMTDYKLTDYIKLNSLFTLINYNLDTLCETLTSLENSIAFSKLHITHHSILSMENIEYIYNILKQTYKPQELLFNDQTDYRDYYDLIESGSYYVDNTLVFVLKIPIMYSNIYDYYHLYPTPTYNNTLLIPIQPYLAMNSDSYWYMDEVCNQFKNTYYCKMKSFTKTRNPDDCIYSLILKQKITDKCTYIQYNITSEVIDKIDDYNYLITCPAVTKISSVCTEESFNFIQGTYLVEIPKGCKLTTETNIIRNSENKLRGHPVKLLSFELSNITIKNRNQPLKLDDIHMNKLYKLKSLLEREKPLNLETVNSTEHYFWTTPLYIIIIIILIYYGYLKFINRRRRSAQEPEAVEMTTNQPFFTRN